ncbi:MAG TPA: ABC transporter substrate-binding protein [Gaiellaceae bacterium]|nr:ABC transporter substrate-binding protein [Gaiellaceae bacterium]
MKGRWWLWLAGMLAVAALALAGCGGDDDEEDGEAAAGGDTAAATDGGGGCESTDQVTLQLKWVTQAQFAGYYAAKEQGSYEDECLDVEIKVGGPDITPEQVVASGQAEFGIDWLPSLLATRDQGGDLVNIAQVFERSGMTEVTWKDSGITDVAGMRGKKVGVWCCGNEFELFAALTKNGIDPKNKSDVTIVNQPFDMNLFLQRQVDAAAAMTYNELAQVLEQENPDTGELYTLDDLNVITMEDAGTAMLEDGVFTRGDWISEEENQDIATRFLKASFEGWIFCRDNPEECLQIVLDNGPTLGEGHQRWQLNEINALIWPNEGRFGVMNEEDFQRTADIAKQFGVIKEEASDEAYVTDYAEAAVQALEDEGVDVVGSDWEKEEGEVTPGGE